jgi:hypothetical protein
MADGPHPPAHVKIRWNGVFTDAQNQTPWEIWSNGVSMGWLGATEFPQNMQQLSDAMVAPWANFIGGQSSVRVRLTEVKASYVKADGLVARDASGAFVQGVTPADVGAVQDSSYPSQVSIAVSLDTAFDGAVGRGRFFIPGPGTKVLVRGQMTANVVDVIAAAAQGFLNAVNQAAAPLSYGPVAVASAGSVTKGLPPALRTVTRVRVGSRLDTIRSRANALDEQYVALPLA